MAPSESSPLRQDATAPVADLWYLRTPFRRWVSLIVLCLGFSFAQGPLMSFQVLEPVMIDDGIFQCNGESHDEVVRALDMINSVGLGLASMCYLFLGLYFDVIGPRMLAMVACTISVLAFLLLGLSLQFPCALGSFGFTPALFAIFIASSGQSFAALAYLYLCLLYTSPSPRDRSLSRMPSSA